MEVAGKLTPGSGGGAAWGPGRHLARSNSVRKGLQKLLLRVYCLEICSNLRFL